MIKHSIASKLLQNFLEVLEKHRAGFGQERVYWRGVGMVLGEISNFERQTVTHGLLTLGIRDGAWSSWSRLFSEKRYKEERVAKIFLRETLPHTPLEEPYVVGGRWYANPAQ